MKSNLNGSLEKKYDVKIIEQHKNKYDEEFITLLDNEDKEKFTIRILPGEYILQTFKRVFGER